MESDSGPEGPTQWVAAMCPGFSAQHSNRPPDLQPTGGRAEADLTKTEEGCVGGRFWGATRAGEKGDQVPGGRQRGSWAGGGREESQVKKREQRGTWRVARKAKGGGAWGSQGSARREAQQRGDAWLPGAHYGWAPRWGS